MSPIRTSIMVVVTVALAVGVAASSRIPYSLPGHDKAMLRLSWRYRGEKIQSCRKRTQQELDALPIHMRTPEECTTRLREYVLRLSIDDEEADSVLYRPSGAKGDRPIFVYYGKELSPGLHELEVEFEPVGEHHDHKRKLEFDDDIEARRGYVTLITIQQTKKGRDRLVVVDPVP